MKQEVEAVLPVPVAVWSGLEEVLLECGAERTLGDGSPALAWRGILFGPEDYIKELKDGGPEG